MGSYPHQTPHFDATQWSDASARGALTLISQSVAQMVGFEVAVISAVQGDVLVSVAIEGNDDVRNTLAEMYTPVASIRVDLDMAEDWGRFKFVGHEHSRPEGDPFSWVPIFEPGTEPDAWHPLDLLIAPLYSEEGELCGLLSIDLPISRRRPDPDQRILLERYAEQAERALLNAFEREALARRLRLAEAARQVVRIAVSQPDVEAALYECRPALLQGFRADDLRIRTYPDEFLEGAGTPPLPMPGRLRRLLRQIATRCWEQQRVGVMNESWLDEDLLCVDDHRELVPLMSSLGFASSMMVPIGAGQQCLGHLILVRKDDAVPWTPDEQEGALEVTRDIGHAVLASRNLVREQRLVTELRRLDGYKTRLLSTVSHELKNPIGAIAGHLELVAGTPGLSADTQFSLGAMDRATTRLSRVVADLLTLAKLEDPDTQEKVTALDLRPALLAALGDARFAADRRSVSVHVDAPEGPIPVCGDEEGVQRVLTNLLSNAIKYTGSGGAVTVTVTYRDVDLALQRLPMHCDSEREVEVEVADQGLGISENDLMHLFTEFFRSTNPTALAEPGTGLGLAISERIITSYGGRITVESTIGVGSTFRVFLPAPKAPAPSGDPRR